MSSGSVLQVVILRNGGLVGTEMLVSGDYRIGRDASCDLHIDEPTLSRVHARLVFNGNRVGIQDLGSDNGVLINGEKIQAREVKSLDDVQLGRVTLKLKIIAKKDEAPAEKPPLDKTVPLAARPTSAQLRGALEPVHAAPVPAGRQQTAATAKLSEPDPEVTAPGQPPAMAVSGGGLLNATQPSARRAQVAPEISAPPAPPRPVIGLVPPPGAAPKVESRPVPPPPSNTITDVAPRPNARAAVPPTQDGPRVAALLEATVPKAKRPELLDQTTLGEEPLVALPPGAQPSVRARVSWGDQMTACRTFAFGEAVTAFESEGAPLPVYHLGLEKPTVLARVHSSGWAIHVPAGAKAFVRGAKRWEPTQPSLDSAGMGIVPLPVGGQVRIEQGRIGVEFSSLAPQPKLPPTKFKLELSLLIPLVAGLAAAVSLVVFMPKNLDVPDFVPKQLPALRAALVPPTPKPKEQPKKKEEKVAEKRNEEPTKKAQQPQKVAKVQPKPEKAPPVQAPAAMAALAKLTASPAMSNLLSATSKIGGGGKPNGLKMVGLKGIGPVALAGAGPGIGGGFGGGPVTGGREQLAGIGAIGVGHALKGAPGGVVVQAPAKAAQVHGSISREEIAKVINAHMQQIRGCYERALLHEPGLSGKLVIEWTIDMSGAVSSFKTKTSTMKNPDVGECILDNMKSWRFPRPTGGQVVVSYPFVFNSVGF